MKKPFVILLFMSIFILPGCTINNSKPIISINSDSNYVRTFNDLSLGILFDYHFKLPNADKSWVNLWVERYQDGEMSKEPITQLSYGFSPNELDEGDMGFGMINEVEHSQSVFLYAPSIKSAPQRIVDFDNTGSLISWDYAFDKKLELEYGKTYILAVYRETKGDSMRSGYDYQDEQEVEELIMEHDLVYLLKIKIEER